jgi:hypothetical protein
MIGFGPCYANGMSEHRPRAAALAAAACGSLALALLLSCGKLGELPTAPTSTGPPEPIDPTATFTRIENEIFTPTCGAIGCHGRLGAQEQLTLVTAAAYSDIVGKPSVESPSMARVQPLDPNNSYLYRKITGVGITGDRMPQGGPFLTDVQQNLVRDWIRRGAPND